MTLQQLPRALSGIAKKFCSYINTSPGLPPSPSLLLMPNVGQDPQVPLWLGIWELVMETPLGPEL